MILTQLFETALRDKEDLQAKRKALQDIQNDPSTANDPQLKDELMWRKAQLEKEAQRKGLAENAEELNIGDDVIITGPVQYKGATGVIKDFGRDKRFVIVDLYNHGTHSFHSSDVEYNDYADSDEEEADMYDRGEFVIHADDEVMENAPQKHIVIVTVSDPDATAVTQRRGEEALRQRRIKVTAVDRDSAIATALAWYRRQGYKVHDHHYVGLADAPVDESLADEFMAMAKAKGYNPRLRGTPDEERKRTQDMLAQRAADRANAPKPAGPSPEERAELEKKLADLERVFDPDYDYSDDYSVWKKHDEIYKQIRSIKQRLAQGVAEGVATTIPELDAKKYLRKYGADHFKTTTNELHFYKNGQPFSVDLVLNPDTTRSVTIRSLNAARRGLTGQGVTEAETDYQKRRQRERDVDAGKPVAKQRQPKMTDYQKRRAQQKKDMDLGETKSLTKRVRVVKTGETGTIRQIKHGAYKGAPKTYYVDLDNGGQADNLPASALRLIKDQADSLNELSPDTLASYKKKAGADASAADRAGNYERGNKRFRGIVKATIKQGDQDAKKHRSRPLTENSSPVESAILHRIMVAHTDVLAKYGPQAVMDAANDVADYVGDVDEIGTSDVSAWVKQTIETLDRNHQLDEISKQTLGRYVKLAGADIADRASSSSFKSGAAGDKYNKADPSRHEINRERGIDRAIGKLTK